MTSLWNDLDRTISELDRLMGASKPSSRGPRRAAARPQLAASRDAGGWTLRVDLPGVPAADTTVKVEDGVLHVGAQRTPIPPEGARGLRQERVAWTLDERLELPRGVDVDAITATLRHGRLHIRVPLPAMPSRAVPVETD